MVDRCSKCGKGIRFIKRTGSKALMVNKSSLYFIPDDSGELFITTNGELRRGIKTQDGLKGFILHEC